jgi:hypothetical protein
MSTFVGGKAAVQFRKDMEPLLRALQWYEKCVSWDEWSGTAIPYSRMTPEDAAVLRAFRKIKKTYGLFPEKPKAAKAVTKTVTKKAAKKTTKKK